MTDEMIRLNEIGEQECDTTRCEEGMLPHHPHRHHPRTNHPRSHHRPHSRSTSSSLRPTRRSRTTRPRLRRLRRRCTRSSRSQVLQELRQRPNDGLVLTRGSRIIKLPIPSTRKEGDGGEKEVSRLRVCAGCDGDRKKKQRYAPAPLLEAVPALLRPLLPAPRNRPIRKRTRQARRPVPRRQRVVQRERPRTVGDDVESLLGLVLELVRRRVGRSRPRSVRDVDD